MREREAYVICAVYPPADAELAELAKYCDFNCRSEGLKVHNVIPGSIHSDNVEMLGRCFCTVSRDEHEAMQLVREYLRQQYNVEPEYIANLEIDPQQIEPEVQPDEEKPYTFDFIKVFDPLFNLKESSAEQVNTFYDLCRNLYTS